MGLYTKIKGPIGYTLVGSPTDNNGVISGFAAGKCAKTSENLDTTKDFELVVSAVVGTCSDSSFCTIFRNSNDSTQAGFSIGLVNYKFMYYLVNNEGTAITSGSTGSTTFTSGTSLLIKFEQKDTLIRLSFSRDNGATWTIDKSFTSNKRMGGANGVFFGGGKTSLSTQYWRGTIDLNNSYINVDNISWFGTSFSKVKINTGLTKYTVVGSPTITSDGIVNGFSNSNYITTQNLPLTNNNFEFKFKFTISTDITSEQFIFHHITSPSQIALSLHTNSKFVFYYLDSNGNRVYSYANFTVQANTTYEFIAKNINNTIYWWAGTPDNLIQQSNVTINYSNYTLNKLKIGSNAGNSYFRGSIDLNASYIKINNGYFWRGSHQNINAWKIQQDNFSKYYTIVDGKLMWANPNIYLQSSGTQYINTEILPSNDIEFDVKFLTNNSFDASNYGCIFGGRTSSGSNDFQVTTYKGGASGTFRFGPNSTDNSYVAGIVRNQEMKTSFHNLNYSCGTANYTVNSYNFSGAKNIYLFGLNNNDSMVQSGAGCRIYYAKFKDNNIERRFVPVPKGLLIGNFVVPSNGMFDIVEQKFYENKGTGEFTIGGIPEDYIIEGGKLIWCNSDIYLESTGVQKIGTGIYQNNNSRFVVEFEDTEKYGSNSYCWPVAGSSTTTCHRVYTGHLTNYIVGARYNNNTSSGDITTDNTKIIKVDYNKNKFYINDVLKYTFTKASFTDTRETFLFNDSQQLTYPFKGKMHYCSFYNNDIIQRHFVPVPKGMLIGDKIAPSNCMFDMVTQTFFENQGTGDFIIGGISGDYINVGDNIVWVDKNVYLKSTRTQYIDTNYIPKNNTNVEFYAKFSGTFTTGSRVSSLYGISDTIDKNFSFCANFGGSGSQYNQIFFWITPYISASWNIINPNYNQKQIISTSDEKATWGTLEKELPERKCNCNHSMLIYGAHYDGVDCIMSCYDMQIYNYFKITEGTKIMRYFLPVNTNTIIGNFTVPAPGMWDAVTKRFYPNKGSGNFTYGKDS